MTEQPVNVNRIAWRDLFPWTIIFRTLPIALSVAVMVWATVGVVLTPIGWIIGEQVFLSEELKQEDPYLDEVAKINRSPYRPVFQATDAPQNSIHVLGVNISGPRAVYENMVKPFRALFRSGWTAREYLYFGFGAFWSILVWSFAGVAISRICVLRLTRDEPLGIDDAFDFALQKYKDCAGALGMPLLGVAILCIPMALMGLLLGFDIGVLLMGALWFLVLIVAAIMTFLLLGLMFGWPLIVASISTEGQNAFDALTRAFAYTFQRPLNYALYMFVAILFGGFCWLLVSNITNGVVDLGYWATAWGANRTAVERIEVVKGVMDPPPRISIAESNPAEAAKNEILPDNAPPVSGSLRLGRRLIRFWNGIARTFAAAFVYGLFWCMASAIYLLLRRDVDETEMDEVYLVDEKRTYDLPPLKSDEHGIPQVQDPKFVEPAPDNGDPSNEGEDTT